MMAIRKGSLVGTESAGLLIRLMQRVYAVNKKLFVSRSYIERPTVGIVETSPPVRDVPRSRSKFSILTKSNKIDTVRADARTSAVGDNNTLFCLFSHEDKMVHFAGSVPRYLTAALNDGKGATVVMCPLKHKVRIDNVFGGSMTLHKDANGNRVSNHFVRRGTVRDGRVSCNNDGRMNARLLHNSRVRAVASAKKKFHEVHGSANKFQVYTATICNDVNAIVDDLKWIADTDASLDFLGLNHLTPDDKSKIFKATETRRCSTGAGPVLINKRIRVNYTPRHRTNAWIMPNKAPPCLSVGQRCIQEGWGFYWSPFCNPVMCSPDGLLFRLQTLRNVPYLSGDGGDSTPIAQEQLQQMNSQIWAILNDENFTVADANDQSNEFTNAGGTDGDDDDSAGARAPATSSSKPKLTRENPKATFGGKYTPHIVTDSPPNDNPPSRLVNVKVEKETTSTPSSQSKSRRRK